MTHYIKYGDAIYVRSSESIDLGSSLPVGTYVVQRDDAGDFYLTKSVDFNLIPRYYGDTRKRAERIINTFKMRSQSTGVMLTGEKGSGKTLLAKLISHDLRVNDNMPTIIVNTAFTNTEHNKTIKDGFLKFMSTIDTPSVILFDEFEKMYDNYEDQQSILTLLDGLFASNKLFIFTCNDKYKIDTHLRNRPSRIYYMIDYVGLEEEFIREFLSENLKHEKFTDEIVKISGLFKAFNFDMLQTIVEEINRYGCDPLDAVKYLNVKPENDGPGYQYWTIEKVVINGKDVTKDVETNSLYLNPFRASSIEVAMEDDVIVMSIDDMYQYDAQQGRICYRDVEGTEVTIKTKINGTFDISKVL
jgi:hypothetical protein